MKKSCFVCFRTLSDRTRLEILKKLQRKSMNVQRIQRAIGLRQPTITHHLQKLESQGIIERNQKGREVWYSFNHDYSCPSCKVYSASQWRQSEV